MALRGLGSFSIFATVWIGGKGLPGVIISMGEAGNAKKSVTVSAATSPRGICFVASFGQGDAAPFGLWTTDVEPERWYHID